MTKPPRSYRSAGKAHLANTQKKLGSGSNGNTGWQEGKLAIKMVSASLRRHDPDQVPGVEALSLLSADLHQLPQ